VARGRRLPRRPRRWRGRWRLSGASSGNPVGTVPLPGAVPEGDIQQHTPTHTHTHPPTHTHTQTQKHRQTDTHTIATINDIKSNSVSQNRFRVEILDGSLVEGFTSLSWPNGRNLGLANPLPPFRTRRVALMGLLIPAPLCRRSRLRVVPPPKWICLSLNPSLSARGPLGPLWLDLVLLFDGNLQGGSLPNPLFPSPAGLPLDIYSWDWWGSLAVLQANSKCGIYRFGGQSRGWLWDGFVVG